MAQQFYMCRLEQETEEGKKLDVAWLEDWGAKVGARVKLNGEKGLWTVKTVDPRGISTAKLKEKQGMDRRSLQSLEE